MDQALKKEPLLKLNFLSHGTVECADLTESRRFYEEVLGLEVVQTSKVSFQMRLNSSTTIVCVQTNGDVSAGIFSHFGFDLETEEEQAWARHILVADEETALDVIERINNGEDFITLAQELSTDTGSAPLGGDLGWFGHEQMVAAFDLTVFELEIGEISAPVESNFGWHVIQLLGREVRSISEQRLATIKEQTFQNWVTEQRANSEVVINETWSENIPEEPAIPPEIALP